MKKVFPTMIYNARLTSSSSALKKLNAQILLEADDISSLDAAGLEWSKENYRNGFTSYASANALQKSSPTFADLERKIDAHVKKFSKALELNLGGRPLKMVSCWINVMQKNTIHSMHLHPLSVISGTYYVSLPKGSSPIKFEDPRLSSFMAMPPRKEKCREENRSHIEVAAKAGDLVLFESWLRHEVPLQPVKEPRVSVSFNYAW